MYPRARSCCTHHYETSLDLQLIGMTTTSGQCESEFVELPSAAACSVEAASFVESVMDSSFCENFFELFEKYYFTG